MSDYEKEINYRVVNEITCNRGKAVQKIKRFNAVERRKRMRNLVVGVARDLGIHLTDDEILSTSVRTMSKLSL